LADYLGYVPHTAPPEEEEPEIHDSMASDNIDAVDAHQAGASNTPIAADEQEPPKKV
jgi:hypothetical protein